MPIEYPPVVSVEIKVSERGRDYSENVYLVATADGKMRPFIERNPNPIEEIRPYHSWNFRETKTGDVRISSLEGEDLRVLMEEKGLDILLKKA